MHPSGRGGTVVPMHTLHRLHISSRFLFESLCSVAWVGFVLWLTIPWLDDIGGAVTMPVAVLLVVGFGIVPGVLMVRELTELIYDGDELDRRR